MTASDTMADYQSYIDNIEILKPGKNDLCLDLRNAIKELIEKDDVLENAILYGEHFDPTSDRYGTEESLREAAAVLIPSIENKEEYYEKYHSSYVWHFWSRGVFGSIDAITSDEITESRGESVYLPDSAQSKKVA